MAHVSRYTRASYRVYITPTSIGSFASVSLDPFQDFIVHRLFLFPTKKRIVENGLASFVLTVKIKKCNEREERRRKKKKKKMVVGGDESLAR